MDDKLQVAVVPQEDGLWKVRDNLPEGMVSGDAALVRVTGVGTMNQPVLAAFDYQMGDRFLVVKVG